MSVLTGTGGATASTRRARLAGRETDALVWVQSRLGGRTVRRASSVLNHAGEHAGGWVVLLGIAALVDPRRRHRWLGALTRVVAAHGASVVLKRVVRRVRPVDPRVRVRAGTPSRWSFPSSHATSTTTAAVTASAVLGTPVPLALVPAMTASRLVLGVHHPSDVVAGVALGATLARWPRGRR